MELESCLPTLSLFIVLLFNGIVCSEADQEDAALQNTLIKRMDNIQSQLAEVSSSMHTLDSEIAKALYNCLGTHSELCEALEVEAGLNAKNQLGSFWRPGKRAVMVSPELHRYRGLYQELRRKRAMVNHLLRVLQGADGVLTSERKRSCKLNLGFHCQTEEISDFADMYDYLSSANSPGKKRSVRAAASATAP